MSDTIEDEAADIHTAQNKKANQAVKLTNKTDDKTKKSSANYKRDFGQGNRARTVDMGKIIEGGRSREIAIQTSSPGQERLVIISMLNSL